MNRKVWVVLLALVTLAPVMATPAFATNGMNMEGYGPVATGMGGASMAYDNGTAAMMNNPATLGLMSAGDRLDIDFGYLGPHITSSMPGMPDAKSSADAFFMPAIGWAHKANALTYGLGVFSQGGMGTEYDANSFMAAGSGDKVRSELGVGRVLIPVAYNVNDKLTIGGSLDFVWASLDLKMALNGAQFFDLATTQNFGTASGPMVNTLLGAFGAGQLTALNWARFDFSDDSAFTGKAKGNGFAGKIGGVYKVSDALSIGASYHSKTDLGDMEATGATVSMNVAGPATGGNATTIPVMGKIKVVNFQWPQTVGAGAAYKATDKLTIVFDYKWINWKDVMKDFKMSFTADSYQWSPMASAFGLNGSSMDATLKQNWKDQNVFMLGAGYKVTDAFTARVGVNIANNPIPDYYMNPLFPAIEKDHYMIGGGYVFNKTSSVDASFTYAPEVKATNGQGVTVAHSQTNVQLMYSYLF